MKYKRLLTLVLMIMVSFTLVSCKDVENLGPRFVVIVDGEVENLISIQYEHTAGTSFDPDVMIQNLVESGDLMAIDYVQDGVIWGNNRKYVDISEDIICPTFIAKWLDGEDANFDGVVDELDDQYNLKTDIDGNYILNEAIINLVGIFPAGSEPFGFTLEIYDEEGDFTTLSGEIVFV